MNIFDKKLKMSNHAISKAILVILVLILGFSLEGEASDDFLARLFGRKSWQTPQQAGANAQQSAQAAEREKAAIKAAAEKEKAEKEEAEKQAREKEIAARIAFEKEATQKQISQRQEDERKAEARRQQRSGAPESQVRIQQPSSTTPQNVEQRLSTEAHKAGQSFGSSLLGGVVSAAKSTNPHDVPGFQTDKPKEASLDVGSIGDAALAESRTNETAQHLHAQAMDRKTFKIDPDNDPLLVEGNRVVSNPQKAMNEEIIATSDSDGSLSEEIKTCEEGGEEFQQSCSKQLQITLKITPATTRTDYSCPGHAKKARKGWSMHYSHWTEYCNPRTCTPTTVNVAKVVEVASEKWIDGCSVLESLTEQGLCRYESKTTSPQNETKTIQGEPITRDHFEEHYRYTCFKSPPVSNSCAGLREKGCFQIDSRCKEKIGDICILWEQTYSCPSEKKSLKSYRASSKESPFCLTGNCADTSYEANNEMMNTMSHLYALREAQNDLKNSAVVFKGQHRWCTRNCLDFRDCCGSGNGWGVSLHLSSCDAKEIELKTLRDKRLCVQVGTYCAERDAIFNSCLRKKTTFCCYGTKMARLIQENGRAQLGIGFGSPEHPNCEGLSPEQLSRIDFSRINFSEIFEDIKNQTVAKDQGQSLAQVSTERLQNNMTLLTKKGGDPRQGDDLSPPVDQKQLATKHLNAEPLDEKSAQELQKLKEKGL